MTNCRYDKAAEDYLLPDGEPCKVDDYGDPTRHCTARRHCSQHIGHGELTCARCIGNTRGNLRKVVSMSALMLPEALNAGVESTAANLAGPGADYGVFSARRNISKRWLDDHIHQSARDWCDDEDCTQRHFKTAKGDRWHKRGLENALADLIEDDDERHPYSVLTRWQMMLSEDWGHDLPERMTITGAAAYLERNLSRLANDPEQDWALFAAEVRKVHSHLEGVLHNSRQPERGAPCPECRLVGKVVRMVRKYAHWCESEDCERFHFDDDSADVWACPADKAHWFTAEAYANYLEERGA